MNIADYIDDCEAGLRMAVSKKKSISACIRCGRPCQPGENKNPKARPFKRARKGLCENCVVTQFLLCDDLESVRIGLLKNGIEVLKIPAIQKQFAEMLKVGGSELPADDIDWEIVVNQWDLTFPKGYEP